MVGRVDVEWIDLSGQAGLRLTGLAPGPVDVANVARVYPTELLDEFLPALPPMAGQWSADRDGVRFQPRFGFAAGTSYTVLVPPWDDPLRLTIVRHAEAGPATTSVVAMFPTAGTIPYNQLRVYVCFSAPMSEGLVSRHLRVVDDHSDKELPDSLLSMDPELWDRDRRRLTILFDPARIKRGLRPHEEAGYPLVEGRAIRIVVDRGLLDAAGRPLRNRFERRYEVGPDVRHHVDPHRWTVLPPRPGTTDPVVVDFDRSLDYGLLLRSLAVSGSDGERVDGSAAVGPEERSWAFIPARPWPAGRYRVLVDHRLEDVAGNSLSRVFDRDLRRADHDPRPVEETRLPFSV